MNYDKLIITIVNHGTGEKLSEETRKAGARGGTILVGKGSRNSAILRFLSIADIEKDVLLTLVTQSEFEPVFTAIKSADCCQKHHSGVSFTISIGGKSMSSLTEHELITIIVNRGYADDIMQAARGAGARGGTILHARGTGKPDDEKFFGITIVPEKEQVLILAETSNAQAIKDAIATLPCLTTPGIGIMYTIPVDQFVQLGK